MPTYQVRIRNLQTRQETVTLQQAATPEQAAAAVRHLGKVIEVKLSEPPAAPSASSPDDNTPPPPTNPAARAVSAIQKLAGSSSSSHRQSAADQIDAEIRRIRLKATYRPLPILLGLIACMLIGASGMWWLLMVRDFFELAPDNLRHEITSIEASLIKAILALVGSIIVMTLRAILIHVSTNALLQQQVYRRQALRAAANQR